MKSKRLAAPLVAAILAGCRFDSGKLFLPRDSCVLTAAAPECMKVTVGIDGFTASNLINPTATPLIARIQVEESVRLEIRYTGGWGGCAARSWNSVSWQSTDPSVATVGSESTGTFPGEGVVSSAAVLSGVAPGTVQISAILHFDAQCYPARDQLVNLVVSGEPACYAGPGYAGPNSPPNVCRTIDAVTVVPK